MATFELYLDGTQMESVPKFDEFEESLERDYTVRGIILKYPNEITLFGDAYKHMYDLWVANGPCQTIEVIIQKLESGGVKTRIDGLIFLTDVAWDWDSGSVRITIEDNTWSARIQNNWTLPINVLTETTKNGDAMTPVSVTTIEVYNPTASLGTYLVSPQPIGVRLKACLTAMLTFITDGVVGFSSGWLDTINDAGTDSILVTTGNAIRTGVEDVYVFSLETLLRDIMNLGNLWFDLVDNRDGTWTFRLEHEDFFFDTEPSESFNNVKSVEQSTDSGRIWSSVRVGGQAKKDLDGTLSLPYYKMTTAAEEQYWFFGECNISDEYDISTQVITDSNIIEDLVMNNNSDYDDDVFFIMYSTASNKAIKYKYADLGGILSQPYFYNEIFLNNEVLNRYEFPNTLKQTFGAEDDLAEAELSTDSASLSATSTSVAPMIFDTEISDVGGNYNPVNGRYTAGGAGTFSFSTKIYCALTVNTDNIDSLTVVATLIVRDAGGTQRETHVAGGLVFFGESTSGLIKDVFEYDAQWIQYLEANGTVEINVSFTLNTDHDSTTRYQYYAQSKFNCIATYDGGGAFIEQSPLDYKANLINFREGIPDDEWARLKLAKSTMYLIDRDGNKTMRAWVKKFTRNILTGETDCELISNLAQGNKIGA